VFFIWSALACGFLMTPAGFVTAAITLVHAYIEWMAAATALSPAGRPVFVDSAAAACSWLPANAHPP